MHGLLQWCQVTIIILDLLAAKHYGLLQELVLLHNSPKSDKCMPRPDLPASTSLYWWLPQPHSLAVCEWLNASRHSTS